MRGSLVLLSTTACSSGEYQRSLTVTIGRSLPILPAEIVKVTRVPSAATPSIVCVPNDSLLTSAPPDQADTPPPTGIPGPAAPMTAPDAVPMTLATINFSLSCGPAARNSAHLRFPEVLSAGGG